MDLTRGELEFARREKQQHEPRGGARVDVPRTRHAGAGDRLRVDEAPKRSLDALVPADRDGADDRLPHSRVGCDLEPLGLEKPRRPRELRPTRPGTDRLPRSRNSRSGCSVCSSSAREYSTGMIRASFTVVPKRLPVLWAKTIVFASVTLALMLPSVLIAFFASQSILSRHDASYSWSHPGVARAVIGAALYLTVVAVLTLALGTIIRNTAGGIVAFAAIFFVLPPLMNVLPSSWNDAISPFCRGTPAGRSSRSRPIPRASLPGPASACSARTQPPHSPSRRSCSSAATPDAVTSERTRSASSRGAGEAGSLNRQRLGSRERATGTAPVQERPAIGRSKATRPSSKTRSRSVAFGISVSCKLPTRAVVDTHRRRVRHVAVRLHALGDRRDPRDSGEPPEREAADVEPPLREMRDRRADEGESIGSDHITVVRRQFPRRPEHGSLLRHRAGHRRAAEGDDRVDAAVPEPLEPNGAPHLLAAVHVRDVLVGGKVDPVRPGADNVESLHVGGGPQVPRRNDGGGEERHERDGRKRDRGQPPWQVQKCSEYGDREDHQRRRRTPGKPRDHDQVEAVDESLGRARASSKASATTRRGARTRKRFRRPAAVERRGRATVRRRRRAKAAVRRGHGRGGAGSSAPRRIRPAM